ncbi:hypothetical protein ACOSP7_021100 [Xanthoceras sorbifolium]
MVTGLGNSPCIRIPLTPNSIDSSRKHNTHHPPTKLPTAEMARPKNSILPTPSTQR